MGRKKSVKANVEPVPPQHNELAKEIEVSVKLDDVLNHLDFLKKIDTNGQDKFYVSSFIYNAIRRYEEFWIPFVLKMSDNFEDDLLYAPPLGDSSCYF